MLSRPYLTQHFTLLGNAIEPCALGDIACAGLFLTEYSIAAYVGTINYWL